MRILKFITFLRKLFSNIKLKHEKEVFRRSKYYDFIVKILNVKHIQSQNWIYLRDKQVLKLPVYIIESRSISLFQAIFLNIFLTTKILNFTIISYNLINFITFN